MWRILKASFFFLTTLDFLHVPYLKQSCPSIEIFWINYILGYLLGKNLQNFLLHLGNQKYISVFISLLLKFENNFSVIIMVLCILIYQHICPFHFYPKGGTDSWFMVLFSSNETHPWAYFCFILNRLFLFLGLLELMLNFSVSCCKVFRISVNCSACLWMSVLFYYGESSTFFRYLNFPLNFPLKLSSPGACG